VKIAYDVSLYKTKYIKTVGLQHVFLTEILIDTKFFRFINFVFLFFLLLKFTAPGCQKKSKTD